MFGPRLIQFDFSITGKLIKLRVALSNRANSRSDCKKCIIKVKKLFGILKGIRRTHLNTGKRVRSTGPAGPTSQTCKGFSKWLGVSAGPPVQHLNSVRKTGTAPYALSQFVRPPHELRTSAWWCFWAAGCQRLSSCLLFLCLAIHQVSGT